MTKIEIIIKDEKGNPIKKLESVNLELGNKTIDEIEIAVEKLKQKILPEISSELMIQAQKEFTEEKKRLGLSL